MYTIGHSNHTSDAFVALLLAHGIQLVVDVRSNPYSRYVPQANRQTLARALQSAGIAYQWMGDSLGGKPGGEAADYDKLRQSQSFQDGIAALIVLARAQPTAVLCAEGDHRRCHRHAVITPQLLEQGLAVLHIQPDGSLVDAGTEPEQLALL
ncbi:MAG: DUF488 family protein [Anaerolineae bacterium]